MAKELEKVLLNDFYVILKKITDIAEEEIRDEVHAIELYRCLMELEIEQERINLDRIPRS